MEPLKTAVIGVGYLGRFHAQKFSKLEESSLLGVVDNDLKRAEEVGKELGVPWFLAKDGVQRVGERIYRQRRSRAVAVKLVELRPGLHGVRKFR